MTTASRIIPVITLEHSLDLMQDLLTGLRIGDYPAGND
jgi:hypothetical protein